jgi:hypothetical protein
MYQLFTLEHFRLPSRRSGLNTGQVNVGFVVDKVALARFSSEYFVSHGGDCERCDLLQYGSFVFCYQHTLKMEKVSFAETFVYLYQNPRHHILENRVFSQYIVLLILFIFFSSFPMRTLKLNHTILHSFLSGRNL